MSDLEENAKKKPLKIVNNSLSPPELKQDSSGMQNSFFPETTATSCHFRILKPTAHEVDVCIRCCGSHNETIKVSVC